MVVAYPGYFVVAAAKQFRRESKKLSDLKKHFSPILKCLAAKLSQHNILAAGFKKLTETNFLKPP